MQDRTRKRHGAVCLVAVACLGTLVVEGRDGPSTGRMATGEFAVWRFRAGDDMRRAGRDFDDGGTIGDVCKTADNKALKLFQRDEGVINRLEHFTREAKTAEMMAKDKVPMAKIVKQGVLDAGTLYMIEEQGRLRRNPRQGSVQPAAPARQHGG